MRTARWFRYAFASILIPAVAAAISSCGDDGGNVAAPAAAPAPSADLLGLGGWLDNLQLVSCTPQPYDSVTQVVGPGGGVIQVGAHRLTIPEGALAAPVSITAVAPPMNVNLVRFQPDGLQFEKNAKLTMSYANCNLFGLLLKKKVVQVGSSLELLDVLGSVDDLLSQSVTGKLKHFSDYAVAW